MKKMLMVTLLFGLIAGYTAVLIADDDDDEGGRGEKSKGAKTGFVVTDAAYLKECGSCHFAYQPDLLPVRSWEELMRGLDKHFGENAELPAETQKTLLAYLTANAAEHSSSWYAVKFMKSLKAGVTPTRISEIPYFIKEHREIPKKLIANNVDLKSISFCNKCHTDADTGGYSEHKLNIPNHGAWKD